VTAFDVLGAALDDLAAAIRPIPVRAYAQRAWHSSGSIGGHVRHCLDHVDALLRALTTGACNYDERVRGTAVEDDPALACARLAACRMRLRALPAALLGQPLALSVRLTRDGLSVQSPTTVAREVAFVLSHTVHHAALVAVLLEDQGLSRPAHLGLAPSTPAPRLEAACAR
jgi:uncharacterized damage-inducible protein DinB